MHAARRNANIFCYRPRCIGDRELSFGEERMLERILFVGAHHDDLELGLGGSVKRWSSEGKQVFAAFLTNSQWIAPDGQVLRKPELAEADCERSAVLLGFQPLHLKLSNAMDLVPTDSHVVKLLNIIASARIDTLITI